MKPHSVKSKLVSCPSVLRMASGTGMTWQLVSDKKPHHRSISKSHKRPPICPAFVPFKRNKLNISSFPSGKWFSIRRIWTILFSRKCITYFLRIYIYAENLPFYLKDAETSSFSPHTGYMMTSKTWIAIRHTYAPSTHINLLLKNDKRN